MSEDREKSLVEEIDALNKEYEKLKEEYDEWEEHPRRGFHREHQKVGRKLFKLNTQISSRLIELDKIRAENSGKFKSLGNKIDDSDDDTSGQLHCGSFGQ